MSGRFLVCIASIICLLPCENLFAQRVTTAPIQFSDYVPPAEKSESSRLVSTAEDPLTVAPVEDPLIVAPVEDPQLVSPEQDVPHVAPQVGDTVAPESTVVAPVQESPSDYGAGGITPAPDFSAGYETAHQCAHTHQPFCRCYAKPSRIKLRHQKYWGNAEAFCERPFGTFVNQTAHCHTASGIAAQMALYDYDFVGTSLTPRGKYQVHKIVDRMMYQVGGPIVIEATGKTKIDHGRRLAVVDELSQLGVPSEDGLVVTRQLIRPGLMAVEALEIFQNRLNDVQNRGATIGTSTTGGVSGGTSQ